MALKRIQHEWPCAISRLSDFRRRVLKFEITLRGETEMDLIVLPVETWHLRHMSDL